MAVSYSIILIMDNFWGKVRIHNQRGRKLGFPTANIFLRRRIEEGIYISQVKIKNKIHNGLTFIGNAKTFNEKIYQSETFILDFDQDIYQSWVSVKLIKKLRENKKFDSEQELIVQMNQDEKQAREYFRSLQDNRY